MCDEKELDQSEEVQLLFSDDIEILEDRLQDIIMAMGLPQEQTNAALRLVNDVLEDHHTDILDTFEGIVQDQSEEGQKE